MIYTLERQRRQRIYETMLVERLIWPVLKNALECAHSPPLWQDSDLTMLISVSLGWKGGGGANPYVYNYIRPQWGGVRVGSGIR